MSQTQVVIIEDDPAHSYLIERALLARKPFLHVHTIAGIEEAQRWLFASNSEISGLQLMILDLTLPDGDGMEVLRMLKEHSTMRRIPVIVLTARDEDEKVIESYGLSANSYVVKRPEPEFTRALDLIATYWLELNEPPAGIPASH